MLSFKALIESFSIDFSVEPSRYTSRKCPLLTAECVTIAVGKR